MAIVPCRHKLDLHWICEHDCREEGVGGDAVVVAEAVAEETTTMQADTAALLVPPMASYNLPAQHRSAVDSHHWREAWKRLRCSLVDLASHA